jgi:hypothetical protein
MRQGRLRLPNGFSILCNYQFESERHGHLNLAPALHSSLPATSDATLTDADGREQKIRVMLGPGPSAATFEVAENLQLG